MITLTISRGPQGVIWKAHPSSDNDINALEATLCLSAAINQMMAHTLGIQQRRPADPAAPLPPGTLKGDGTRVPIANPGAR